MSPTFEDKDYILTEKFSYWFSEPTYGDIVIAEAEGKFLIKRVVGLGGDTLEFIPENIDTNTPAHIVRNGIVLKENYLKEEMFLSKDRMIEVPLNSVYLLGDNRNNSSDSRSYGPIPLENIKGKVFLELKDNLRFY